MAEVSFFGKIHTIVAPTLVFIGFATTIGLCLDAPYISKSFNRYLDYREAIQTLDFHENKNKVYTGDLDNNGELDKFYIVNKQIIPIEVNGKSSLDYVVKDLLDEK